MILECETKLLYAFVPLRGLNGGLEGGGSAAVFDVCHNNLTPLGLPRLTTQKPPVDHPHLHLPILHLVEQVVTAVEDVSRLGTLDANVEQGHHHQEDPQITPKTPNHRGRRSLLDFLRTPAGFDRENRRDSRLELITLDPTQSYCL